METQLLDHMLCILIPMAAVVSRWAQVLFTRQVYPFQYVIEPGNVAIGSGSMHYDPTATDNGFRNVAVGFNSMYQIDGSANVAIGYNALLSNIDGEANTVCGYSSMADNTSVILIQHSDHGHYIIMKGVTTMQHLVAKPCIQILPAPQIQHSGCVLYITAAPVPEYRSRSKRSLWKYIRGR